MCQRGRGKEGQVGGKDGRWARSRSGRMERKKKKEEVWRAERRKTGRKEVRKEEGRMTPPTLRRIKTPPLQFMARGKLEVGQFASGWVRRCSQKVEASRWTEETQSP